MNARFYEGVKLFENGIFIYIQLQHIRPKFTFNFIKFIYLCNKCLMPKVNLKVNVVVISSKCPFNEGPTLQR